jgi:hypothetical protein
MKIITTSLFGGFHSIATNGYSFAIRFLFFTKTGAKVVLGAVAVD